MFTKQSSAEAAHHPIAGGERLPAGSPVLHLEGLCKSFAGSRVLDKVDLEVEAGEVHAVVGANGSGKSTLVKILAGYYSPDRSPRATCRILDEEVELPLSGRRAHDLGMRFVHQDLGLVEPLSIAENVGFAAGFATGAGSRIHWRRQRREAEEALERIGLRRSPRLRIDQLSPVEKVLVAIARVLCDRRGTRLLVMDEPTAALPQTEVARVHGAVREIVETSGAGVIYVSHHIEELFEIADRITALRDGVVALCAPTAELGRDDVVREIAGHAESATEVASSDGRIGRHPALRIEGATGTICKGVDINLRQGEILGLAGEVRSGKSELGRMLFGLTRPRAGEFFIGGRRVRLRSIADAIRAGIAYIPQDRDTLGAIGALTVRENLTLANLRQFAGNRRLPWLRTREERRSAAATLQRFGVKPPETERRLETLSGGNRQKVLLAKWWQTTPRIFILDDPTAGMDVGAKHDVHAALRQAAAGGVSVLVLSGDEMELSELCDRVVVLRDGRTIAELEGDRLNRATIVATYYGTGGESDG